MPNLTWQHLPPYLLDPVIMGHLTLSEALEIYGCTLLHPDDEWAPLPPHLWSAAQRLMLSDADFGQTMH